MSTNPMTQTNPLQADAVVEQRHHRAVSEWHQTVESDMFVGDLDTLRKAFARFERDYLATEIRKLKGSEA